MLNKQENLDFINQCIELVDNFGSDKRDSVSCLIGVNARVIELSDDSGNRVEIKINKDSDAMEIAIYGKGFTSAGDAGNPAVYVTNSGELIRFHGEMYNAIPFIKQKLSEMEIIS